MISKDLDSVKNLLAYVPETSFKVLDPSEIPTPKSTFGIPSSDIADIIKAAQESKSDAAERIKLLKAIFPAIAEQSEIEERLNLSDDEEI